MAKEESNMLSPEQIQKLAKTISGAQDLTEQQEEIIKKVLAGEIEIGNLRIASLERYFDIYSKNLDLIARKHSALNDTFLILDKKLNDNYQKLSSDITKLEQQLANAHKAADKSTSTSDNTPKVSKSKSTESNDTKDTIKTIVSNEATKEKNTSDTKALIDQAIGALASAYKKEGEERLKAVSSGNSELLAAEKQYQSQRLAQLKQHLEQLADAVKMPTVPQPQANTVDNTKPTIEENSSEGSFENILATINESNATIANNLLKVQEANQSHLNNLLKNVIQGLAQLQDTTKSANDNQQTVLNLITNLLSAIRLNSEYPPKISVNTENYTPVLTNIQELIKNRAHIEDDQLKVLKRIFEIVEADIKSGHSVIPDDSKQLALLAGIQELLKNQDLPIPDDSKQLALLAGIQELLKNPEQTSKTSESLEQQPSVTVEERHNTLKIVQETNPEIPTILQGLLTAFKESTQYKYTSSEELASTNEPTGGDRGNNNNNKPKGSSEADNSDNKPVGTLISDEQLKTLINSSISDVQSYLDKNITINKAEEKSAGRRTGSDQALVQAQQKKLDRYRLEQNAELVNELIKNQQKADNAILELAQERAQTEEDLLLKSIEFRLNKLREATNAELNTQNLKNKLATEQKETSTKKGRENFARNQVKLINAKAEQLAIQELETQRAALREELTIKAMAKADGKLTKKAAADIERQVNDKFKLEEAAIKELTKYRIEQENIALLKEVDPALAAARDVEVTREIADLEFKYRQEHNNQLDKEAKQAIRKQVELKYSLESEEFKRIASLQAANEKLKRDDPELAAARDAAIAQDIADLEFKYRKEHNNQLDQETRDTFRKQIEDKYALEGEAFKKLSEKYHQKEQLKKEDPSLNFEVEKHVAEMKAQMEYEARSKNNGRLLQEDLDNIKKFEQEYIVSEEKINEIASERFFREKEPKLAEELERRKAKFIADEEYKARKANHGKLTATDKQNIKKLADEQYKLDENNQKKLEKLNLRQEEKEYDKRRAENRQLTTSAVTGPIDKENNIISRFKDLKAASINKIEGDTDDSATKAIAALDTAMSAISDLAKQLDSTIDKIAEYKGTIDTRLQGSEANKKSSGSYWDQLTKDMMKVGAVTPFFKQEDFANNIKSLVEKGISFDLKQRAFLMTIQEKIANTFDVADGTLLRLIRLQQEDSTAGRLGMESALNTFLNEMYETSEYLSDVAKSVRSSLTEMEALMSGAEATEVEYQVQKWMGSLYSVGMSQDAVQNIANTLGQLAAGQIEALTNNSGTGNLLVMAANDAGIPISDILANGLNAEDTNKLLQATVNYLADIANSSKNNNVVQQQLANVFGVKASDLRAATNLKTYNNKDSTNDIFDAYLNYDAMLKQLNDMAATLGDRVSLGEKMSNIWANGQYTLAGSMASSPAAYLTYKMAALLESTTGGIALPAISVMGNSVDLETTVADLMRVAGVSVGIMGSIGPMLSGIASSFNGQAMLSQMGIGSGSGLEVTRRGGDGKSVSGGGGGAKDLSGSMSGGGKQTTSSSGYMGNANSSDIKNKTLQEAEDTKKQHMIEAKEESEATQIDVININVLKIYELLDAVTNGRRSLSVKVESYGLTQLTNNYNLSNAQGGVGGLTSQRPGANNGSLDGGFGTGGNNSTGSTGGSTIGNSSGSSSSSSGSMTGSGYGASNSVNLGGWTT